MDGLLAGVGSEVGFTMVDDMKKLCGIAFLCMIFYSLAAQGQTTRGVITVEIASLRPFQLHIALTSEANKRITIDKSELPWATRYSMVLVVVKADGECLEKVLPVEDPPMGKIFLGPLQTLRGNLDLEGIFKKFDEARQKSDLHLFWAYQVPNELNSVHWVGGWIVIPKDRNP